MTTLSKKLSTQKYLLYGLFLLFLVLRLFVGYDQFLLGSDHLKYIYAANHFPYHTLYNDQPYLLHPPGYPYVIHFFKYLFFDDYAASLMVSLACALASFFVIYRFFMLLTSNFPLTYVILVLYTLSSQLIISATVPLREPLVILLIFSTLYFYLKGIKLGQWRFLLFAAVLGGLLALTSDHVIFVIPVLGLIYLFFNPKPVSIFRFKFPGLVKGIVPALIIIAAFSSWTLFKYSIYSSNEYYPNGYEGMPLHITNLNVFTAITPQLFEDYYATVFEGSSAVLAFKRAVFNFGYILNMEPFAIPKGLNFTTYHFLLETHHVVFMFLIYIPLALLFCYGSFLALRELIAGRKIAGNVLLFSFLAFLVFLFPMSQQLSSPRYIFPAYFFFYLFLAKGIIAFGSRFNLERLWPYAMLVLGIVWIALNPHISVLAEPVFTAKNAGEYVLANIPPEAGIMAQPGYTINLMYQTPNRFISLHGDPSRISELIDIYDIDYVIFGRYFTYDAYHLARDSALLVANSPDKYELVASIKEDYSQFYDPENPAKDDVVYVYKVRR